MTVSLQESEWPLPATYDSYAAWVDYRGALAGQLDGDRFGDVARAFRVLSSYQGRLARLSAEAEEWAEPVGDYWSYVGFDADYVKRYLEHIQRGLDVLRPVARSK